VQTKRGSLIEATINTIVGTGMALGLSHLFYVLSPFIQQWIWAGFKWEINWGSNIVVTIVLTFVSVLRSYIIRRTFNKRISQKEVGDGSRP